MPKGQRQFDTRALHRPCPEGPPLKAWYELVYKGRCTEKSPCFARSLNSLRNPKRAHMWHAPQAALLCVRQDTLTHQLLFKCRSCSAIPAGSSPWNILSSCPMTGRTNLEAKYHQLYLKYKSSGTFPYLQHRDKRKQVSEYLSD